MYVSATEENRKAIEAFGSVILSEMNVGEVKELSDTSSLESNFLTVNFKVAGRVLRAQANPVKAYLAELDDAAQQALSAKVMAGEPISIESLGVTDIPAEVFTVNSKSKGSIAVHKDASGFVALDCEISEELMRAGLCRDIVRQCQVFRKNAGFDVSDRIYVQFVTESDLVKSVLTEKQEQLSADLLATFAQVDAPEFTGEIDLDGAQVKVLLKRV
jgi:isoleucyl-tRNA synthetase